MSEEVKNNVTAGPENDQNQQAQNEEDSQANNDVDMNEEITLTREEYEAQIKSESDRKAQKKMKEAEDEKKRLEKEYKKELEQKTAEARKEAEELAKLSETERMKVEKDKEELRLQKERETLEKERSEFERERLMLEAEKQLSAKKLPVEFAAYILGEDADDTFERITVLEEQWQKAIESEVNERLKGKAPRFGSKPLTEIEQIEKQLETATGAEKVNLKMRLHALKQQE